MHVNLRLASRDTSTMQKRKGSIATDFMPRMHASHESDQDLSPREDFARWMKVSV